MIREPVHAALFAKLEAIADFKTASRRFKHWTDVNPPDHPALFLTSRTEVATQKPVIGTPVWDIAFDVALYVHTGGDVAVAPASLLNTLLDAIEKAMRPDDLAKNKNTLGGLVEHCWIEGQIQTDEGVLGDQGVAIVPILVRVV